MRVTVAAPAKVNLWLHVGSRENSGFHSLSTLFCALDLADTVVLRKRDPTDVTGLDASFAPPLEALPELGPETSNLAVRAARLFLERAGVKGGVHIHLVKRIPAGAGLGGGSSDAGAVLRALRRMYPRGVDDDEFLEIAVAVGSDVPFFIQRAPLAHGSGRGERLTPVAPLPPRPVVLVLPPFPIHTGEAYGWLDLDRGGAQDSDAAAAALGGPAGSDVTWEQVADRAANDFEGPVFDRHPELRELRDALRDRAARPALLAGSGSTVFGVFKDTGSAEAAARSLRSEYPDHRVILTGTRAR